MFYFPTFEYDEQCAHIRHSLNLIFILASFSFCHNCQQEFLPPRLWITSSTSGEPLVKCKIGGLTQKLSWTKVFLLLGYIILLIKKLLFKTLNSSWDCALFFAKFKLEAIEYKEDIGKLWPIKPNLTWRQGFLVFVLFFSFLNDLKK